MTCSVLYKYLSASRGRKVNLRQRGRRLLRPSELATLQHSRVQRSEPVTESTQRYCCAWNVPGGRKQHPRQQSSAAASRRAATRRPP